jgi:choline monooxygenase
MKTSFDDCLTAFNPDLPLARARTIPATWYLEPEIHALEQRAVFGDCWHPAGRLDQITEPGSFVTAQAGAEPVLVVRGEDGVLRGFFNVCRHRASPVATAPCGKASRLRCRYHGWTYDLAGNLRGVPEFDGVEDFRREDNGLFPLAVDSWGPYAWVYPGKPTVPLAEALHPLPERVPAAQLAPLRWVDRREYDVACNWKVYVDNFLDGGYHVNTVHPGLAGVLDYVHYRTEVFANSSVQSSPMRPSDNASVTAVRSGRLAQYWWVFPNFMLNLYEGVMDTNLVLPLAPDRCRVIFDYFFADTEGPQAQKYIQESIAVAHQVQLEDVGICEEVQRGLSSHVYQTGRFSVRREAAGYHFHQLLARRLQAAAL